MPAEQGLRRGWRAASLLLLMLGLLACDRDDDDRLLPGFRQSSDGLREISLTSGGGEKVLTLDRSRDRENHQQDQWTAREYQGWPVSQGQVQALLATLAQARIVERKTSRVDLHPRLGVEDVAHADAGGLKLAWRGGAGEGALILGKPGPAGRGQYVRLDGSVQALRVEPAILSGRNALAWLDRQLLDLPAARIREVRVQPRDGSAFAVRMDASGHVLAGVSPALSADDACTALAGALERLEFEDIESSGAGVGAAAAEGSLNAAASVQVAGEGADFSAEFLVVDGRRVVVTGWRRDARYWVTLSLSLDDTEARTWLAQGAGVEVERSLSSLRREVDGLQARLAGRRFLIGIERAAPLIRRRPQYLRLP